MALGVLEDGQTYEQYLAENFGDVPQSTWTRTDRPSTQALKRYATYGETGLTAYEQANIERWLQQDAEQQAEAKAKADAIEAERLREIEFQAEVARDRAAKATLNVQEYNLYLSGAEKYSPYGDIVSQVVSGELPGKPVIVEPTEATIPAFTIDIPEPTRYYEQPAVSPYVSGGGFFWTIPGARWMFIRVR